MRADISLVREPKDRTLPPSVFIRAERAPHRPVTRFIQVRIHSKEDVETVRRANLPVSLFDSARSEALGYPLSFKPILIVAKDHLPAIDTPFRAIPFLDSGAARSPSLEDYIVAMLKIDTLGARRIAKENAASIDSDRLLKRIIVEGVEDRANRVRLDEFAPGLPKSPGVKPIAKAVLKSGDSRPFVQRPRNSS
jgi:hypothetical protein